MAGTTVIWLNGTVGAGKSAVGQALAYMLPSAIFLDGDDYAGPSHLPNPVRWLSRCRLE
jgi:shikimate kinase